MTDGELGITENCTVYMQPGSLGADTIAKTQVGWAHSTNERTMNTQKGYSKGRSMAPERLTTRENDLRTQSAPTALFY